MRSRCGTDIARAIEILRNGGLVGLPTETVYGLAADADNPDAVARIFAAKGRPSDHPLIVHIPSASHLGLWSDAPSDAAVDLADGCWPGPLTVVVPAAPRVIPEVTGGRPTVGLRVPAHPLALELLNAFGGGLAAPSANRFGRVSPTTAEDVIDDLGIAVDYVLDGGPCPVGIESTIVDCTTDPPQVLRPGGLDPTVIERVLGGELAEASGPSRAPGMMASHYAPTCRVEIATTSRRAEARREKAENEGLRVAVIDLTDDLVLYAQSLYRMFRNAQTIGIDLLIAVQPPAAGLGHAIRDRLAKAAAPRT